MNILYITHNTNLRSTTCVIDATIHKLIPEGLVPSFVFPESGPWVRDLQNKNIPCYFTNFFVPEKNHPINFMKNLFFWIKIIKKEKIQIIHLNEHDNYPMLKHAARLLNVPLVVGVRFVLEGGYAKWAFSKPYSPHKLLFTSSDQLNRSKSELPDDLPEKCVTVFGNGRDLDTLINAPDQREQIRQSWEVLNSDIILGTASAIRPRKRIDDFIYLVKHLRDKKYPVKGVIAGGGQYADSDYVEYLQNLIIELKLTDSVKMIGNLEEMSPFYQGIDIFVSTSELETFGMSVCEAMAFSMPVFGYQGGSVQEVLSNDECIVTNKDLGALKDKLESFLSDMSPSQKLGERNKTRVFNNFNAQALADKLLIIYEEILGQNLGNTK